MRVIERGDWPPSGLIRVRCAVCQSLIEFDKSEAIKSEACLTIDCPVCCLTMHVYSSAPEVAG